MLHSNLEDHSAHFPAWIYFSNRSQVVETIPGFEVNQGYGFGTNSMTTGEKNTLIWGGLAAFFALFLGGYALS